MMNLCLIDEGPNRGDSEETEGEEGHDDSCEEIPERWDISEVFLLLLNLCGHNVFSVIIK